MKKLVSIMILVLCAVSISAQEKEVTKFLGIPVDGTKAEMRQKLIEKGFTPKIVQSTEFFEGEFNGHDVRVYIVTNNNKVWRIMVCEKNVYDEEEIKIHFNRLVSQFEKNKRYNTYSSYTISDDEDVGFEIDVHNKKYDAIYYQKPSIEPSDSLAIMSYVYREMLSNGHTEEDLKSPKGLTQSFIDLYYSAKKLELLEAAYKKSVWFRICGKDDEYYITMYYDNEFNHADGEDL